MKTVRQWLEFLKEDTNVTRVNMELIGGLRSRRETDLMPEQALAAWEGWLDDKVHHISAFCDDSGYILKTISQD